MTKSESGSRPAAPKLVVGPLNQLGVRANPHHDTIGASACHLHHLRPAAGDDHRHEARCVETRGARPAKLDRFTGEQVAHHANGVFHLGEARRHQTDLKHGRVARGNAENETAGRVGVDAGDAACDHARMARDRIYDQRADSCFFGILGRDYKIDKRIARMKLTIGKPKMLEACLLRPLAGLDELLRVEKIKAIGTKSQMHCKNASAPACSSASSMPPHPRPLP